MGVNFIPIIIELKYSQYWYVYVINSLVLIFLAIIRGCKIKNMHLGVLTNLHKIEELTAEKLVYAHRKFIYKDCIFLIPTFYEH